MFHLGQIVRVIAGDDSRLKDIVGIVGIGKIVSTRKLTVGTRHYSILYKVIFPENTSVEVPEWNLAPVVVVEGRLHNPLHVEIEDEPTR
jgi:hypothetical protein